MVTELHEANILSRVIDTIRRESKAVTIAGISIVVSVLAVLMAWMAVYDAKEANIRSQMQNQTIEELADDIARETEKYLTKYNITQQKVGRVENWAKAHGVPIEEIYDGIPDD